MSLIVRIVPGASYLVKYALCGCPGKRAYQDRRGCNFAVIEPGLR